MFVGFWQHTHSVNGFHLAATSISQLQLSVSHRWMGVVRAGCVRQRWGHPHYRPNVISSAMFLHWTTQRLSTPDVDLTAAPDTIHHHCHQVKKKQEFGKMKMAKTGLKWPGTNSSGTACPVIWWLSLFQEAAYDTLLVGRSSAIIKQRHRYASPQWETLTTKHGFWLKQPFN